MRIEEYIKLRRKQDLLDETDISRKTENIHKIIDYVFDYYKIFIKVTQHFDKNIKQNFITIMSY